MNILPCLEIVRFETSPENDAAMRTQSADFFAEVRRNFPAMRKAYRLQQAPGQWIDVALWESSRVADEAAKQCMETPALAPYFAKISKVVSMQHAGVVYDESASTSPVVGECWELAFYRARSTEVAQLHAASSAFFGCAKTRLRGLKSAMRAQVADGLHVDVVRWPDLASATRAAEVCLQDGELAPYFSAIEHMVEMVHADLVYAHLPTAPSSC